MKPTTTDLITDLDALTHELRRVGVRLAAADDVPNPRQRGERGQELYAAAAMIDEWITELVGSAE